MTTYSFITVNFNDWQATMRLAESIHSLRLGPNHRVELVVVDNNSRTDDVGRLQERAEVDPGFRLIRNAVNIGYFPALNAGLAATAAAGRIAVVGNNDLRFHPDFIQELSAISYGPDTLVIAPNVINRRGIHQNPHLLGRVPHWRKLGYDLYYTNYRLGLTLFRLFRILKRLRPPRDNPCSGTPRFIRMGIGACYVLTEHFFRHYDRLDDRVFLWGEEALLAAQVEAAGGRTLYHPGPVVYHDEDDSVSRHINTREHYRITRESYRVYSQYL